MRPAIVILAIATAITVNIVVALQCMHTYIVQTSLCFRPNMMELVYKWWFIVFCWGDQN